MKKAICKVGRMKMKKNSEDLILVEEDVELLMESFKEARGILKDAIAVYEGYTKSRNKNIRSNEPIVFYARMYPVIKRARKLLHKYEVSK